jgi:hypothetical protein
MQPGPAESVHQNRVISRPGPRLAADQAQIAVCQDITMSQPPESRSAFLRFCNAFLHEQNIKWMLGVGLLNHCPTGS